MVRGHNCQTLSGREAAEMGHDLRKRRIIMLLEIRAIY